MQVNSITTTIDRQTAVYYTLDLAPVVELQRIEAADHGVDDQPHRIGALAHLAQA